MVADESGRNVIKSDVKLLAILERVRENQEVGVTEIAADLDMAKSTVHAHLNTLEREGYVVKEGSLYRLGLRFLSLGISVREEWPGFEMIREKVDELAADTGERVQFIVEEHGYGVYVYRAVGESAVETDSRVGKRVPLNAISAGKAILAFVDEERIAEIVDDIGLPGLTENTITDPDVLRSELEGIRKHGFARNVEESTEGLRAVGVPILNPDGTVIGAISVSGPSHRLTDETFEQEIPNLILGAVNEIELKLRFS
ncbi:IclR family transcriptional regulator [Halobacteriales archaeon QS_1_68_17]|nr:MAG: IclR family transcriptional regulator [Halobacteriales archaeon QS_1_68_17]